MKSFSISQKTDGKTESRPNHKAHKTQKFDINESLVKNKKLRQFTKRLMFSRVALIFLLIVIQILIFYFFILKLNKNFEIYLGGSLTLSFIFMVFLSNSNGKNEFKIAWMLPLILFPLLGIAAYLIYHTNIGAARMKKNLQEIKLITSRFHKDNDEARLILEKFPEAEGLGRYLIKTGSFFPHENNRLSYFKNGEMCSPRLLHDVENAKSFIFLEFFIIHIDESWQSLVNLLEEKAKQGVEVRLIFDSFGSIMISSRSYKKYLESKGIKSLNFSPITPFFSTRMNNRDHRKIIVIDGKIAYTGGLNIANEYFNIGKNRFEYWKDNAVRIEGSASENLTTLFLQTWNIYTDKKDDYKRYIFADEDQSKRGQQTGTKADMGLVIPYGDDAFNNCDIAEDVYYYIIENAKKYLYITSPYVILDNHMMESLIFAARRGVSVNLIVPSRPDHLITFCVGKTFLKTLMENGANIFLYEKGFIHAKTFISDDKYATVGSVNLDYRSFFHHFECGAFIHQAPVIADIKNDFEETLRDCTRMTPTNYKKLPWRYRFLGRIFRIVAPLI
ncbi:MAG: cardiolipin synthase [Treponema sp.]|nr:cardiolipin synthase [Treponema sp.]